MSCTDCLDFTTNSVSCFSLFFQEEDPAHDETSLMAKDVAKTSGYRAGSAAVTYTRWGHNRCPYGVQLVYSGAMAGSHYSHQGGGSNYLGLPDEPNYKTLNVKSKGSVSYLYGTEYEHPIVGVHDHGAPCAVCYVPGRSVKEMIPATTTCPSGWTREYYGYIMSGHYSHRGRTEFLCIDRAQKSLPGSAGNQDGALLYHVQAVCTGIHCPPYKPYKALTCVVCSK